MILCPVEFLKTLAYENALQCVNAAADFVCQFRVSVMVVVFTEPDQVLLGEGNSLWHAHLLTVKHVRYFIHVSYY